MTWHLLLSSSGLSLVLAASAQAYTQLPTEKAAPDEFFLPRDADITYVTWLRASADNRAEFLFCSWSFSYPYAQHICWALRPRHQEEFASAAGAFEAGCDTEDVADWPTLSDYLADTPKIAYKRDGLRLSTWRRSPAGRWQGRLIHNPNQAISPEPDFLSLAGLVPRIGWRDDPDVLELRATTREAPDYQEIDYWTGQYGVRVSLRPERGRVCAVTWDVLRGDSFSSARPGMIQGNAAVIGESSVPHTGSTIRMFAKGRDGTQYADRYYVLVSVDASSLHGDRFNVESPPNPWKGEDYLIEDELVTNAPVETGDPRELILQLKNERDRRRAMLWQILVFIAGTVLVAVAVGRIQLRKAHELAESR